MRAIISEVPGAMGAQRKGSNKSGTATGERAIYADTRRLSRTWLGNEGKNGFWKEATADAKAHELQRRSWRTRGAARTMQMLD